MDKLWTSVAPETCFITYGEQSRVDGQPTIDYKAGLMVLPPAVSFAKVSEPAAVTTWIHEFPFEYLG